MAANDIVMIIGVIIAILFGVIFLGWMIGFVIKILWDADAEGILFRPLVKWGGIFIAVLIFMFLFMIVMG